MFWIKNDSLVCAKSDKITITISQEFSCNLNKHFKNNFHQPIYEKALMYCYSWNICTMICRIKNSDEIVVAFERPNTINWREEDLYLGCAQYSLYFPWLTSYLVTFIDNLQ